MTYGLEVHLVKSIREVLGLVVVLVELLGALTVLGTGTTLATLRTRTTLTTLGTLATLTACRTLLIALGLVDEYTVRKLELTGLRINHQQLDGNLVALLDTGFLDSLQTLLW